MPSPKTSVFKETRGMPPMPPSSLRYPGTLTPPSDAELCERAVEAIWHSLDVHDLVDDQVRSDLANILEPLSSLALGERLQRLINTLRLPNPIDASHLYWLTRRLLTLVPELQAAASARTQPGGKAPPPLV